MTADAEDPFVHLGLLYRDECEYLEGVLAFVEAGRAQDRPVLVAVPEPNLSALTSVLGQTATFVDMSRAGRNPAQILPDVLLAFAEANPGACIVGEPLYPGRDPVEVPACVRHEALINQAFAGRDEQLLCPYDATRLTSGVLHYAERTHPVVCDRGQQRPGRAYADPQAIVTLLNQPLLAPRRVDRSLVFDAYHPEPAQTLLAEYAPELGADRTHRLWQAVVELASIMPARAGGATVRLRLWREAERIVCELHGPGEAVDPPADQTARSHSLAAANARCDLVQTYLSGTATVARLHVLSAT